jgi:hypothetical protein
MEIFDQDGNFSKSFFLFMKYNLVPSDDTELSDTDRKLYDEFVGKVSKLQEDLEEDRDAAKATAASLFSMFGYSRHYCAMTGQPIIGKYFKLNGKIVSKEAYEAHKIVQEIEGFEEKTQQKHNKPQPKKGEWVNEHKKPPKKK